MKTPNKLCRVVGIAFMLVSLCAQAYLGERIVLDPSTGDYTITYWDDINYSDDPTGPPAGLLQTTFVPATKIAPAIRSKFRLDEAGFVVYSYTISNGASAKQSIVSLSLEQTARIKGERDFPAVTATEKEVGEAIFANMSALDSPNNWSGNIYSLLGYSRVVWSPDERKTGGVKADRTKGGFGFASLALPGLSEAQMKGEGAVFGYAGEGPADDSAILAELDRLRKNNFIARPAAVPTIPVPIPFDAAVVLERIQAHAHTWITQQLIDPAFSSQLDRYFQSAISAYRLNQPKAGKKHIQTMRELIKKEHADADREDEKDEKGDGDDKNKTKRPLIDKLAARVLDFDLKYVAKRMGGDKDD